MSQAVQDLILVKTFLMEGESQLERDDDFGNGLAVSLAQDAAELFLRVVVRERSIPIEVGGGLHKLVTAINRVAACEHEKVPHVARIEDLNKARVNFKHSGLCPSRSDATKLVRYGYEFLEECFPRFFGHEYRSISLAHQIKNEEVQKLVLEAEKRIREEDWQAAVIAAAQAYTHVEQMLAAFFPPTSRANVFGDNNPAFVSYLNVLRSVALAGLVGYDPRDLVRFRGLAPTVLGGYNGSPAQVVFSKFLGPFSVEHAEFCHKFVLEFALAVQKRLG